jgi:hypothetical protein
MQTLKILVVATSHSQMNNSNARRASGWKNLRFHIIFSRGRSHYCTSLSKRWRSTIGSKKRIHYRIQFNEKVQKDPEAISLLAHSEEIGKQHAKDFDFVFLLGGHGPLWDFTANHELKLLLEDFNRGHKFIGAVCHGVAGLLPLVTTAVNLW